MHRPDAARPDEAAIRRFARIEAVLDEALDQPPALRAALVRDRCSDDDALCREVMALLDAMAASDGYLDHPAAEVLPVAQAGMQLGAWTLQRPIGRGGSGEVWLGVRNDGQFEQQVAIKLLRDWQPDDIPRFLREQRLLARLDHPGIARLLDAGSAPGGRPYMVMEFVAGAPLTEHVRQHAMGIDARLALFRQVCDAVAFAHRHLIVHRDLKPQNILVRADGRVALLDFGIARLMDEAAAADVVTRAQRLTPQYAAPEQLAGEAETTSTDVYALGLLLHEMLAGQPPWGHLVRQGAMAVLQRATAGPPPAPSTQARGEDAGRLRGDLDAIVHKATRPEPDARYASVEALRQDIENHLSLRPVQARGDALGYRLRRALRRYSVAASLSALFVIGLVVALAAVSLAEREAARERDIAQMEASRSKAVRDYLAHMFRDASQQARAGAPLTAKQVLEQAAARVDAGFAADPAAAAEVLKALGELHFYIDDYAGAAPLLERWLAHESAIADPVAAADVRFTLAETLHRTGRSDEAADLLAQAQAFWSTDAARHADVLLVSRMLQSQLERQRGDVASGIATLEAALPLRLQRSGAEHFETAALYTNLGAAYIQAGRFDEGIAVSQEAMRTWTALNMERGNDALNTLNNLAAAYFRQGDMRQAEQAFASALALRREGYGPSAATAALIGNYARTLLKNGKPELAVPLAKEAEDMARLHAGDGSPLTLSLQVTHAEGLLDLRRFDAASSALEALAALQPSQWPVALQLRADLLRGRLSHARGDVAAARAMLERVRNAAQELGHAADPVRSDLEALHDLVESAPAGSAG
ncbi:MAG TPA: serine/threonine-protein kinase [Dokdonella sp.]|uniref:serine/threonine-protein kinase n=1 Tax=Dokdonella sp. TaxID=2291710 RepID=UPI002CCEA769|nr:serine/threonine-protein kinase [Dokdonella sp.]HUD40653.1 serine/threonine-protein kinase [Dokdonella sp.]